jgi:hypothetical protein
LSLPNTKPTKYIPQQIITGYLTGNRPQVMKRLPYIHCQKITAYILIQSIQYFYQCHIGMPQSLYMAGVGNNGFGKVHRAAIE